ncbi:MAG TPA: protein YgfX [Noviherbaspirillum sp.]|nr:protein YgfX [Noviherbaspirillum sp.]
MSIAVSAVVKPSRLLFLVILGMSFLSGAVAILIGLGALGAALSMLARFVLVVVCGFTAGFGFYHGICQRKTIHMEITRGGQIRIREAVVERSCGEANRPHVEEAEAVRLMPESTIWPQLLLLRLQAESGKITSLAILPDSVRGDTFRALAASCRWIAARYDRSSG